MIQVLFYIYLFIIGFRIFVIKVFSNPCQLQFVWYIMRNQWFWDC